MQLWRLSGAAFADRFDGGYGLEHAGRWNERGRPVCLLRVPSVIVPVPESDDRNIIVNHRHRDAARIMISRIERFACDPDRCTARHLEESRE